MWLATFGDEFAGVSRQEAAGSRQQREVTQLFEETREDVYRYLLSLGLYPPQAQETTQEVFLRLYAAMKKGDEILSPKGWIFRVAHNLGLKVRSRQEYETPFDPALETQLASESPDPEGEMLSREETLRIHRAVAGLSEQQRRCLFLRLEGLRYPEIGAALGISASAVGEFLRRAMLRLRKAEA